MSALTTMTKSPASTWPLAHHLGLRVADQDGRVQRDADRHRADVEVAIGELFRDEAGGDGVHAEATEFLRQVHAQQAQAAHLGDEAAVEVAAVLLALLVVGQQAFARKAAGGLLQGSLIFGQYHRRMLQRAKPRLRSMIPYASVRFA